MDNNTGLLSGLALLLLMSMAVFAVYKWRQFTRGGRVDRWVKDFLFARYGEMPKGLHINCSNDREWPVLVDFPAPRTGIRQNLAFSCSGPTSTYSLLSETEE